jgi:two-component system, response regulator YesN
VGSLNSQEGFGRRNGANAAPPEESVPPKRTAPPHLLGPAVVEGRVQRILQMVESGTTLNIRELALEFHLSSAYLQRLFKQQTGVSMGEWMNEQRLQRAATLLANSYMSVKEIAYTIGYEHASSFIRAFEKRFSMAPLRYRKQCHCAKG